MQTTERLENLRTLEYRAYRESMARDYPDHVRTGATWLSHAMIYLCTVYPHVRNDVCHNTPERQAYEILNACKILYYFTGEEPCAIATS